MQRLEHCQRLEGGGAVAGACQANTILPGTCHSCHFAVESHHSHTATVTQGAVLKSKVCKFRPSILPATTKVNSYEDYPHQSHLRFKTRSLHRPLHEAFLYIATKQTLVLTQPDSEAEFSNDDSPWLSRTP